MKKMNLNENLNNTNLNIDLNSDWMTEDPIIKEIYYIKDGSLYTKRENQNNSTKLYSENNSLTPSSNVNFSLNRSTKFSQNLSGKNILISGGGTIATLGNANNEDYVVVNNVMPKGIQFLEFICPMSCQGLLFGMCSIDINNLTQSTFNILNVEKKNFKTFRTTSRRRVGMEIDYTLRTVRFYLEGVPKDKTINFNKKSHFPCIIIAQDTSVILNTFTQQNNVKFPFYFSKSLSCNINLFKRFLFIVDIPKIKLQNFNQDEFLNQNFVVTEENKKIFFYSDENEIVQFVALRFDHYGALKKFKSANKDVKINDKLITFLDRFVITEIMKKYVYTSLKLGQELNLDFNILIKNNYEQIKSVCINIIDDYETHITKWIMNNFDQISFTGNFTIFELNNKVERVLNEFNRSIVINKNNNFKDNVTHEEIHSGRKSTEPNKLIIEYLPINDSLLLIDDAYAKVFKRNENGKFDVDFLRYAGINNSNLFSDKIDILMNVNELELILNYFNWSKLLNDSANINEIEGINSFFNSVENSKMINKNLINLRVEKLNTLQFSQNLINYLNKLNYITKNKEKITQKFSKSKKDVNVDKYDKEIDSALPFAPNYDKEDEEDVERYIPTLDNYSLEDDSEKILSIYKSLLKLSEQVHMNTLMRNTNRISSSYARLSTFVNYPLNNNLRPEELSDKGLYVENTLTNELKLYGQDHIKLVSSEKITNSETLQKVIETEYPFTLINKSNLFPNININYSINTLPNSPQFDPITHQIVSISNFNKSYKVPLIITTSNTGLSTIWNYTYGLTQLSQLNIKKGIKQIEDFKDIVEIDWLKSSTTYNSLIEIFSEEKFDVINSKPQGKLDAVDINTMILNQAVHSPMIKVKKEKDIIPNQEMTNNLYIMGFPIEACKHALKENKNNFDKALEFLLEKTGDKEFMSKFTPIVDKDVKIQPWQCKECTFLNEKGEFTCEICGAAIPDKLMKEFMDAKSKREELRKLSDKMEDLKIDNIPEEEIENFKDSLIKNIHFLYDPTDPVAPFIVVAVLFDVVLNRMILSIYKLMINPYAIREFIFLAKDEFICKIDNKRHSKLEDAIAYLNSKYFNNLNSLYPQFVGGVSNNKNNSFYNHLIPVEHSSIEIPVQSIFDSFVYESESSGGSYLTVLVEKEIGVSLINFNIKNKYKFNLISNKSLEIDYVSGDNIQQLFSNIYPTELRVVRDSEYYYVITQDSIVQLDRDFILVKSFPLVQIGLFKKVDFEFNQGRLESIRIVDDLNGVIRVNLNRQSITNGINEISLKNNFNHNSDVLLNLEEFSNAEFKILTQLLEFETVGFKLDGTDENKIGLVKSNYNLNCEDINNFKKIYIDLRKTDSLQTTLKFSKPSLTVMTNLEFIIKSKNKRSISLNNSKHHNKDNFLITYNFTENISLNEKDLSELKNLIPLTVLEFNGSQSQVNVNVSSIIFGEGRFITNYPRPDFLFSHLHNKQMNLDSFIIGSELTSKIGEVPFGEGLIFLLNDLESIGLAREFADFTEKDFNNFMMNKKINLEEVYEWEPICYINLGENEFVKSKVFKMNKNRLCRYVYLLPTNGRNAPKDFRTGFNSNMMSLIMFAAEGSESSTYEEEEVNYLDRNVERLLKNEQISNQANINISLSGYNDNNYLNLYSSDSIPINSILPNSFSNLDKSDLFISKIKIDNLLYTEKTFENLKLEFTNNDSDFELIGVNVTTLTYKYVEGLKESKTLSHFDIHKLRKIITEKDQFDLFNKKFVEILFINELDSKNENKRLNILKYFKYLINHIPLLTHNIINSFDFLKFITLNILQSSNVDLIHNSIDFLRILKGNELLATAIYNVMDNLSSVQFTHTGFMSFISLFKLANLDDQILNEKMLKIISNSLNIIKEKEFQTGSNIFLKSHLKIEENPFDTYLFSGNNMNTNLNSFNANQINSTVLAEIHNDTLRLNIDLHKLNRVNSLKLYFSAADCIDTNFRIFVWGDTNINSNNINTNNKENFNLINFKSYLDYTWKQLTKYETLSTKNRQTLFNTRDLRSIVLDDLNCTVRYIIVEISISNMERLSKDFPENLFIAPQIFGEEIIQNNNNPFEYKKLSDLFRDFICNKTEELVLSESGLNYTLKQGNDMSKYMLVMNETNENVISINDSTTELSKLKQNLKTYQNNLDKMIQEIIKRRDPIDNNTQSKIKIMIEDIKIIQIKINSINQITNLGESSSVNICVLTTFIKHLRNNYSKNHEMFQESFDKLFNDEKNEGENKIKFIQKLLEICIFNHSGELQTETLLLLKESIWPICNTSNILNIDQIFTHCVENYLTHDTFYRSALQIIEAISSIDFSVDIILTKLKEAFRKSPNQNEEEIPDAFFNISSLIILLIMKLKKKDHQIAKKCVDIINTNLEFIKYLTKFSKFNKEVNNIILAHSLNLLQESFKTTDFETLNKIINPELIEYMVSTIFELWDNIEIKTKLMDIIDKLINPFDNTNIVEDSNVKLLSDKITLNTQLLAINFIESLLNLDVIQDDKTNKLDYILNLLIKTYSINSGLVSHVDTKESEESIEIKNKNSIIIEMLIKVMSMFNHTHKIGYSVQNNFWKYLIDILERGNLDMLFYNKIFSNLILKSFLNFETNFQELLYSKIIKVFQSLFNKPNTNLNQEMFDEVVNVILEILKICSGTKNEYILVPFITQLAEIILSGETPILDSKLNFTTQFKISEKTKSSLFIETSNYLINYLNLGSFTGSISSNKTIYDRLLLSKVLLQLISTYQLDYLNDVTELDDNFSKSIRNYLIFLVFDCYAENPNQSPTLTKVAKTWTYVQSIIDLLCKRKKLIEVMLTEFMKVVRQVDEQVFQMVISNKMALKKGIVVSEKLFSTLEQVLNKCLQDDEITKFFAFELQGFKFFIDRVNTHRKNIIFNSDKETSSVTSVTSVTRDYKLNSDLLNSLTVQVNKTDDLDGKEKEDELYKNQLTEYNYEEFANTNKLNLLEGEINQKNLSQATIIANINWSNKKKGAASVVYSRDMKDKHYHEETFLFQLNHLVEVKDIFIGFNFNITNMADKLAGVVPCVYLEAGCQLDKMDICVKLDKIEDSTFLEKGVIVYGFNFYSFLPDFIKIDDNYIKNLLNQLPNCRGKFFRFTVRRPHLLSNENSHTNKISGNNVVIGINHVSIIGTKLADTNRVIEYIQEKEKNVSIKLISKIFTAEFIDTLKYIARDSQTIDNIKQIYDAFEPYIYKHATILSNILINVSKYNSELGDWLLNRLLNVDNSEIHAKLAVEITQNNEEFVNERINKFLSFIIRELNPNSSLFFSHDVEGKLKNIGKFANFFTVSLNGLLISNHHESRIDIDIDFDVFLEIIKNLQKYSIISQEVQHLITVLLVPNRKLKLNKFLDPEESIFILHQLYLDTYIFDYLDILSYLIANSEIYEKIFYKKKLMNFYCEEFINQVNSNLRGKNMLALMNVIKNMSYSKLFVEVVRQEDYDFKILDAIKNKNEKSDTILINNNLNFLNNLVNFIRNCIIDYPECLKKLAIILIEDLEICKKKIDKVYANNVLMPLLRMEKSVAVCIHPVDSFLNQIYSSYLSLHMSGEMKENKNTDQTSSIAQDNIKNAPYLPGSELPSKVVTKFKEIFTSFEWSPKKNFANEKFKLAFSTKSVVDKTHMLSSLSQSVSNQGPFLMVLYPYKTTIHPDDLFTFFYCGEKIPSLPSSINVGDSSTINIPYTYQNFIGQIQGNQYISAHLDPEYDDTTGKEYEICFMGYDSYSANLSVSGDLININLLDIISSTINPYPESGMTTFKSNEMTNLKYTGIKDFEIFVSVNKDLSKSADSILTSHKIISTKYIDETGNLNYERIKSMKYFKKEHPLSVLRNNPVIEIPDNVTIRILKEFLISQDVKLMNLLDQHELDNDKHLSQLIQDNKILDICYDIPALRGVLGTPEQPLTSISTYEPRLPVFESFEKLDGIRKIVSVLKSSITMWKNKNAIQSWIKWVDDVEKFSELPSFFATLIRHQKCFDIIFNLLCGLYDNENSYKEVGFDASKYIYEILNNSFVASKSEELRKSAIDKGIFSNILERLQILTREKPRRFAPGIENVEISVPVEKVESGIDVTASKEGKDAKDLKDKTKKSTKKGVGYGSDHTGDNKSWDVNQYLEGKKSNSIQIASIITLLTNFFNSNELKMTDELKRLILESPILPVLESAFRGATILELAKEDILYSAYLNMSIKLSENPNLINFLLEISKDYKPIQTECIFTLLSQLNEGAKIFVGGFKRKNDEITIEEKIATEINRTYDIVSKNVKAFQGHTQMDKHYGEILKLPVEKSYIQLMRELSFGYMSMKDTKGKFIHNYASSTTGETTTTKMIRLLQEYADLPRSLPCEHTNAIFIRVDQDNMDLMKALIMGSAGTPYGHGAYEFDIYFDQQYPNGPPKVNLMTTGHGSVRFNPNLYANGKVCLSLLGTWRGQSTENWDPKISTLLQVLISIQSIIMSDLVYFNEPSCESEMGKPEGEAKNEAYSNIVRYCNIKYAMIEQIKTPAKGFEEVIRRHFYLKKNLIIEEVKGWIERSKSVDAKYSSFSYDHNTSWAQKMTNPKQYTKMLEEIYAELEKELNALPLPSELLKKTEESEKIAQEKAKKKEKMEFISLDNVDVGYDENVQSKEINIDDEAVKDRWSRYIGAMGIDAVQRQANSSIFLSGANGLGMEISKNLVLSGCKKFVLHDIKKTQYYDLSSQFFLTEDDININRAEACIKKLQQLNFYVKVLSSTAYLPKEESELDKFGLKDFSIVILTQCDYDTQLAVNRYCRKRGIQFISTDLYGVFGRVINDFGEKFIVNDKDGEELKECMIKSIDKDGVVTVLEGTRHNYEDGDEVLISEVVGMKNLSENSTEESINGTKHKVTVINVKSFKIGNVENYSEYIRNGMAKQIKSKKEMNFKNLDSCLNDKELILDENMAISDFTKMTHSTPIHIGFEALDNFYKTNKNLPQPWNIQDSLKVLELSKEISKKFNYELTEKDYYLLTSLSFTAQSQFSPLAAFFGGLVAQEAVKAMTGKFSPINQMFYYDAIEVLPDIDMTKLDESVSKVNFQDEKKRSDGLQVIVGKDTLNTITEMKILVVGAGAIGCELLKNFAMLEVGTNSEKGSIVVTDPDIIEVSNLSRQFLFREKHLRQPKSSTAAAAVIQMNRNLKNHIFAKLDKLQEESEHIFTDNFFQGLNLVANALDNIAARRYVDSRCVTNRIPLLESGTLGAKGHVQVVIPFKTESYSSQTDPEVTNDIPQCTLKMFPEEAMHCVEWARDQFGKLFTQDPKTVNKALEEGIENQEFKVIKKVVKKLKKAPKDFKDCIRLAREKFEKLFHNNVMQLLFAYPLDKKNKDGSLFWNLPKRPPVDLIYDSSNSLHASFIAAYSCLMANQYKIKIPYENPRKEVNKFDVAKKAEEFILPEFKPNQNKAKEIEKQVEKEKKELKENNLDEDKSGMINEDLDEHLETISQSDLIKEYHELLNKLSEKERELNSEEFEKDNDNNYHIDLIHSMSNLRCRNYKLEEMDWMKVKIKAGRIIPALATTTAAIAGLQSLELVKVAKNLDIEKIRNSFLNLAIPYLQASEPGAVSKIKLKEDLEVTLWDRWEVKNLNPENLNLKSVYNYLEKKFGLFPKDCFKGKKAIFAYSAYEMEDMKELKESLMNKNLVNLMGISSDDEYVDVMITFTSDENSEVYLKNVPLVRIYLK